MVACIYNKLAGLLWQSTGTKTPDLSQFLQDHGVQAPCLLLILSSHRNNAAKDIFRRRLGKGWLGRLRQDQAARASRPLDSAESSFSAERSVHTAGATLSFTRREFLYQARKRCAATLYAQILHGSRTGRIYNTYGLKIA